MPNCGRSGEGRDKGEILLINVLTHITTASKSYIHKF